MKLLTISLGRALAIMSVLGCFATAGLAQDNQFLVKNKKTSQFLGPADDGLIWSAANANTLLEFVPVPGRPNFFNIYHNNRRSILFQSEGFIWHHANVENRGDDAYQFRVTPEGKSQISIRNAKYLQHYLSPDHTNRTRVFTQAQLTGWGHGPDIRTWVLYDLNQRPASLQYEAAKLPKATGKWVGICEGGTSCSLVITASLTDGKTRSDTRSTTDTRAVVLSLSTGLKGVNSADLSASHESSVQQAKEIASSREKEQSLMQTIEIDYATYDVRKVWRWVVEQPMKGNDKVVIATTIHTCTSDLTYPPYEPGNAPRENPCLKPR